MSSQMTPEQFQELLELAKGAIEMHSKEGGETIEERIADSAFNHAAESLIDRSQPGEFRNPEDASVMEALQAQTSALMGIGQLLEAILKELRKK